MYNKNILLKESKRDAMWVDMRENESALQKIIFTGDISSVNFILLYSCLQLVLIDIELYENYYLNYEDKKVNNIIDSILDMMNKGGSESLKDFLYDSSSLRNFFNCNISSEERQLILEKFRTSMWVKVIEQKDQIEELFESFPLLSLEQIPILYECLTIVLFELLAKKIEIKIIEGEI